MSVGRFQWAGLVFCTIIVTITPWYTSSDDFDELKRQQARMLLFFWSTTTVSAIVGCPERRRPLMAISPFLNYETIHTIIFSWKHVLLMLIGRYMLKFYSVERKTSLKMVNFHEQGSFMGINYFSFTRKQTLTSMKTRTKERSYCYQQADKPVTTFTMPVTVQFRLFLPRIYI